MDEKKTGMGLLRDATRLCAVPGNAGCGVAYALGKTCGDYDRCADCISTSLAIIADRIEREREEAAEEAREVAGRLRGMRGYESRYANFNLIYLACFGCDAPLPTTEREDFAAVRDRLCDLIERGGKRDPEREKAADWVEANGGLDEVSGKLDAYDAIDDERGYLMELRAEVAARLGVGLDGIAPVEAHARMLGELDKRTEALERYARMLNRIDSLLAGDEQECFAADTPPYDAGELFGAMLGELGKRLMPLGMEWPRFEDGTRLQFGDKFCDCNGNPHTLYSVRFLKYGVMALHDSFSDSPVLYLEEGQTVKRYAEAPIAKDGLPIKVGEIVYGGDGEAWEVTGIENGPWSIGGKNGDKQREMKPKWLTHEVPTIYGKDGLPLLPGQKVITGAGFHMTVESVHYDRCPYGHIAKWVRYKIGSWDLAESVSHAKPKDTSKRIAEDEKKNRLDYWNCQDVWRCIECPSKIGGKNPKERYGVDNCEDAKTIDLYERRRKLDGHKAGGE